MGCRFASLHLEVYTKSMKTRASLMIRKKKRTKNEEKSEMTKDKMTNDKRQKSEVLAKAALSMAIQYRNSATI